MFNLSCDRRFLCFQWRNHHWHDDFHLSQSRMKRSVNVRSRGVKKIFERRQRWLLWISTERCILGPQTTATLITKKRACGRGNAHAQFVKQIILPVWWRTRPANPRNRKFNWCGLSHFIPLHSPLLECLHCPVCGLSCVFRHKATKSLEILGSSCYASVITWKGWPFWFATLFITMPMSDTNELQIG